MGELFYWLIISFCCGWHRLHFHVISTQRFLFFFAQLAPTVSLSGTPHNAEQPTMLAIYQADCNRTRRLFVCVVSDSARRVCAHSRVSVCIFLMLRDGTPLTAIGAATRADSLCHRGKKLQQTEDIIVHLEASCSLTLYTYCTHIQAGCRATRSHAQTPLSQSHYAHSHSQTVQKTPHT